MGIDDDIVKDLIVELIETVKYVGTIMHNPQEFLLTWFSLI